MITLSNNTKGLALLHQVEKIYGKVYTSDSLLETVLYWGINCISKWVGNGAAWHLARSTHLIFSHQIGLEHNAI